MKAYNLLDMLGGWFVGDFQPCVQQSPHVEVALKRYTAGTVEARHVHKVATELTLVVEGIITMNGEVFARNAIVVLAPGESGEFVSVTDSVLCVVKTPSVAGDKYLV
jgi:anti-sigma factor ChrR (cupin superfamily)